MVTGKALSFVDATKPEKRFDGKAFREFVKSLSFNKFISSPFEDESRPLSIVLDTVMSPVTNGIFREDSVNTYTNVQIRAFERGGTIRVYMKDLDAIIDALDKIRHSYKAINEACLRDFPKPLGYDSWIASQNGELVASCCASCN